MARIESLDDIESVIVHWSESALINAELNNSDSDDIEAAVNPLDLDNLVARAAMAITIGHDKTSLSVKLKSGLEWCTESKVYIGQNDTGLLSILNKGQ